MSSVVEKSLISLMPKGEIAHSGLKNGNQRKILNGIAGQAENDRLNGKQIVTDFFPYTTTQIEEWERVYRLPSGALLTNEQRKARINSVWSKIPPGAFDGMNKIYKIAGLNCIARPLLPGEDPQVLSEGAYLGKNYLTVTGVAKTGDLSEISRCGAYIIYESTGLSVIGDGRPGDLVINYITRCNISVCGQLSTSSKCGNFEGYKSNEPFFYIPSTQWTWPLIYVIEREDGEYAQIPEEMKETFYFLTLKNKPLFMWAIARVEYV